MVDKRWLYQKGGRPVIYGPDQDYKLLPDKMKYRHVRFDLSEGATIDHSAEREWRIETAALEITPKDVTLIVPDRSVKSFLEKQFRDNWHYIVLSDLGVNIEAL